MKKIINTTIYKCEYCGKVSENAGAMHHHEHSCHKNPANMPQCWFEFCKHFTDTGEKEKLVRYSGGGGYDYAGNCEERWEVGSDIPVRKCAACGKKLYTPLVGNWKKEILSKMEDWIKMPTIDEEQCPYFENPGTAESNGLGYDWNIM